MKRNQIASVVGDLSAAVQSIDRALKRLSQMRPDDQVANRFEEIRDARAALIHAGQFRVVENINIKSHMVLEKVRADVAAKFTPKPEKDGKQ